MQASWDFSNYQTIVWQSYVLIPLTKGAALYIGQKKNRRSNLPVESFYPHGDRNAILLATLSVL